MLRPITIVAASVTCTLALTVSGELTFDRDRLAFRERDGMTFVTLDRYASTFETGAPALPVVVAQYVVPPAMKVVAVRLDTVETETIPGAFDIHPVQPPQLLSGPARFAFLPLDPEYAAKPYPAAAVAAGQQGSMFGYNIASALVAPVQYSGAEQALIFHSRVRFTFELEPADLGYLRPGNRSTAARLRVEAFVASVVLNPQDVAAAAPPD